MKSVLIGSWMAIHNLAWIYAAFLFISVYACFRGLWSLQQAWAHNITVFHFLLKKWLVEMTVNRWMAYLIRWGFHGVFITRAHAAGSPKWRVMSTDPQHCMPEKIAEMAMWLHHICKRGVLMPQQGRPLPDPDVELVSPVWKWWQHMLLSMASLLQ